MASLDKININKRQIRARQTIDPEQEKLKDQAKEKARRKKRI
jgi:hypothetical protein